MGCDLVVARGQATADGHTLFGHNATRPVNRRQDLRRLGGREFAAGEKVQAEHLDLPQARKTCTVLGSQPEETWGYDHGVNEHGVAVGATQLPVSRLGPGEGLLGTDLVRLTLERAQTARQGVELLTHWIEAHGQRAAASADGGDHAFLVVDGREAFAVEAAGRHWVSQEVHEVRAASAVRLVRQDWDRISPGLAGHAIGRGWWPDDGTKLDFAGALADPGAAHNPALRRWGRATLLLEQQNGHIDVAFLRRLLADHYEGTPDETHPHGAAAGPVSLCRHSRGGDGLATAASLVADLPADPTAPTVAWCAFGPPCATVYFPTFLEGELPEALGREAAPAGGRWRRLEELIRTSSRRRALARDSWGRLQARFDQEAAEFAEEGAPLRRQGRLADLRRLATLFMQHNLERFDAVLTELTLEQPGRESLPEHVYAVPAGAGRGGDADASRWAFEGN